MTNEEMVAIISDPALHVHYDDSLEFDVELFVEGMALDRLFESDQDAFYASVGVREYFDFIGPYIARSPEMQAGQKYFPITINGSPPSSVFHIEKLPSSTPYVNSAKKAHIFKDDAGKRSVFPGANIAGQLGVRLLATIIFNTEQEYEEFLVDFKLTYSRATTVRVLNKNII